MSDVPVPANIEQELVRYMPDDYDMQTIPSEEELKRQLASLRKSVNNFCDTAEKTLPNIPPYLQRIIILLIQAATYLLDNLTILMNGASLVTVIYTLWKIGKVVFYLFSGAYWLALTEYLIACVSSGASLALVFGAEGISNNIKPKLIGMLDILNCVNKETDKMKKQL